jgi:hypothetical protein
MAQVVEHLLCKCKALNQTQRHYKKEKKDSRKFHKTKLEFVRHWGFV